MQLSLKGEKKDGITRRSIVGDANAFGVWHGGKKLKQLGSGVPSLRPGSRERSG